LYVKVATLNGQITYLPILTGKKQHETFLHDGHMHGCSIYLSFYLTEPATTRSAMKRVKPSHTPRRPKCEGENTKNAEETAPTNIYNAIII